MVVFSGEGKHSENASDNKHQHKRCDAYNETCLICSRARWLAWLRHETTRTLRVRCLCWWRWSIGVSVRIVIKVLHRRRRGVGSTEVVLLWHSIWIRLWRSVGL